jgi:ATP-dependent DNA helicase RecG
MRTDVRGRVTVVSMSEPMRSILGESSTKVLATALDIRTVGDLLRHYPRDYAEREVLTPLNELKVDDYVTVQAEIARVDVIRMRQRKGKMVKVVVTDGKGSLHLTFFNQVWRGGQLHAGMRGLFAGKVAVFRGQRQLINPQTQLVDDGSGYDESMMTGLIPVYPATTKFPSWNIRKAVRVALDVVDVGDDPLPDDIRESRGLIGIREALRLIHAPDEWAQVDRARQRLRFDEAFVLQVLLAQRRAATAAQPATPRRAITGGLLDAFDAQLPFTLTAGQQEVSADIFTGIAREHPMYRLLQGEVGSGKTVVALRAMLAVADSGGQSALLAPTEVLAQQHLRTVRTLLGPLCRAGELGSADVATRVALLTGSQGAAARRANMLEAASGAAGIVIGTHALLQENVQFADLGLVVVDEQHRFGVEQRDALRAKGDTPPHVLVMTATPIPRTVAMTVYGDLETSMLTELPAGRAAIQTTVVPVGEKPQWVDRVWQRIREEVDAGRQVYVVCPKISGESTSDDDVETADLTLDADGELPRRAAAAVEDVLPMLAGGPLAGLCVDMLHGRMTAEAKDDVMRRFVDGSVHVLVATTVIEVGVDVPNATVMLVMDADRFGISQLHQLRGRTGRGEHASVCLLVSWVAPHSRAGRRLSAVAGTLDGFELADLDLQERREGDVLGRSQSGRAITLKLLSLIDHREVIEAARDFCEQAYDDPAAHQGLALLAAPFTGNERIEFLDKS